MPTSLPHTYEHVHIHLPISILPGILKNQIMMQLKELFNLQNGIFSFPIKMYIHKQVVIFNETLMNIFSN